jgi:hypothetical protein
MARSECPGPRSASMPTPKEPGKPPATVWERARRRIALVAPVLGATAALVGIAKNFEWGPFSPPPAKPPAWHGDVFRPFGGAARQLGSFVRSHQGDVVDLDVRFNTSRDMGWQPDIEPHEGVPAGFTVWEQCSSPRYQRFVGNPPYPDLRHCFGLEYFPSNGISQEGVIARMSGRYRVGHLVHDQQFNSTQSVALCAAREDSLPKNCS